jgi:hypothetical protein
MQTDKNSTLHGINFFLKVEPRDCFEVGKDSRFEQTTRGCIDDMDSSVFLCLNAATREGYFVDVGGRAGGCRSSRALRGRLLEHGTYYTYVQQVD